MPSKPLSRRIDEAHARLTDGRRVHIALEVVSPDGEVIIRAGGVWDRVLQKYDETLTPEYHRVTLVSSQVQAAKQLAAWFVAYERDDPNRQALESYIDMRRGGKTFWLVLAVALFTIRYPWCHLGPTLSWIIVPAFSQQREIHKTLADFIPAAWFRTGLITHRRKDNYYQFVTGAELWIKSADRPHLLKAGGVACVGVNEGQQVASEAFLNAVGSNIDTGGITFSAMNPPDKPIGLYHENLHDAVNSVKEDGTPTLPFARETKFPAAKNEVIDQAARSRFGALAQVIDPKKAQRDMLGFWTAITDRAYPCWNRTQHYRKMPDGWHDMTAEANALTYRLNAGDMRPLGAGADFQHWPYCVFIELRVLRAPAGVWVPEGTPVYVVTYECANDIARGEWWYEELLCQKVIETGRKPQDYLLIADGTGSHQGSSYKQRGKDADPATFSFPIMERYGFEPHAPIERRIVTSRGRRGSEVTYAPSNPPVAQRLDVINGLLYENRIIVTPSCKDTAEAFRQCEVKAKHPHGKHAHHTDAASYPIWTWETALIEAGVVKAKVAA